MLACQMGNMHVFFNGTLFHINLLVAVVHGNVHLASGCISKCKTKTFVSMPGPQKEHEVMV